MEERAAECLVADDHPALLTAVSTFLADSGFDVVGSAGDGRTAVELARAARPDVALVDYRMPSLFGAALVSALREAAPESRVVVYTAEGDGDLVSTALESGASAVVLKEAPLADLARALRTVLGGGTYVDPGLAFAALGTVPKGGGPALTAREIEVLRLLADGKAYEEISSELSIGVETARTHVRKAAERLGAATRTQAVATALRRGLIA